MTLPMVAREDLAEAWDVIVRQPDHDPRPAYAVLREHAPVYWTDYNFWLVSSYELVNRLSRDTGHFSSSATVASGHRAVREGRPYRILKDMMLFLDGAEHRRVRAATAKVFSPRAIEILRPQIEAAVVACFDEVASRDEVDLVHDFALKVPARVILAMLGVDASYADLLVRYAVAQTDISDVTQDDEEVDAALGIVEETADLMTSLIEKERGRTGDALLTQLANVEEEGKRLTSDEILANVLLLIIAGHETTGNTFVNGILQLLKEPDQFQLLRHDPSLIRSAAEEFLRWEGAARNLNGRWARETVEFGGVTIEAGQMIYGCVQAANHDPAVFSDPLRFDITRSTEPGRDITFGYGPHRCLGAALARQELGLMLTQLISRTSDLRADLDGVRWKRSFTIRGLTEFNVTWTIT